MTPLQEITTKMAKEAGFMPCRNCETPSPKGEEFCCKKCEKEYMEGLK